MAVVSLGNRSDSLAQNDERSLASTPVTTRVPVVAGASADKGKGRENAVADGSGLWPPKTSTCRYVL